MTTLQQRLTAIANGPLVSACEFIVWHQDKELGIVGQIFVEGYIELLDVFLECEHGVIAACDREYVS